MKLSFSTLGCPAWSLPRVIDTAGRLGYDGIELRFLEGDDALWARPELVGGGLRDTRARLADAGLLIPCVDSRSFFHHPDALARRVAVEEASRVVEVAAALGAPGIRVFGDRVQAGADLESTRAFITDALAELRDRARPGGVEIWLETHGDFAPGAAYWQRLAGCGRSPARGGTGQFATLLPPSGDAYLRVQRIDDGPGGCHLDLHLDLTASSLDQTARRAGALGARLVHREPGLIALHSPGGFPFCLVGWHGERVVPAAIELDGTGLHRADQLCLDIPAAKVEAEAAFWSALTGWPQRSSTLPQFGSLQRPDGIVVRLLFQRRDESGQDQRVTGHIDLAEARSKPRPRGGF